MPAASWIMKDFFRPYQIKLRYRHGNNVRSKQYSCGHERMLFKACFLWCLATSRIVCLLLF